MSQPLHHEKIRAFIAIPLPGPCVNELKSLQDHLRHLMPETARKAARWVRPYQMHLTLKFLGDVPASEIDDIVAAMRAACDNSPSFRLALSDTGCFPNCNKPRVLWAGIGGETEQLLQLQARLEQSLAPFGEKQETRTFRPHLTLARIQTRDARLARQIGDVIAQSEYSMCGEWQARQVLLIQSRLLPGGSEYSKLASIQI